MPNTFTAFTLPMLAKGPIIPILQIGTLRVREAESHSRWRKRRVQTQALPTAPALRYTSDLRALTGAEGQSFRPPHGHRSLILG